MRSRLPITIVLGLVYFTAAGQENVVIDTFPFIEDFESVNPPSLPAGWETSTHRLEEGDFQTNTLGGNNWLTVWHPGVEQYVKTPVIDFTNYRPEVLVFHERRTGTFQADIEITISTDGGNTFPHSLGTTRYTGNGTSEEEFTIPIPPELLDESAVVFRWRVIPHEVGGATSNARFDYIRIDASVQHTHELSITNLEIMPLLPTSDDHFHTEITILNAGLEPASDFTVGVRSDEEQVIEEIHILDAIAPGDSTVYRIPVSPLPQNVYPLQAYVDYDLNEGSETTLSSDIHVSDPVRTYPWNEWFDFNDDKLSLQWRTSFHQNSPDASLTSSIVREGEQAIIYSNATREQYLILPPFDVSGGILQHLTFYERRTGTFDATMYVDVSTDRGEQFHTYASFTHPGETDYVERTIMLDESLSDTDILYIRFRLTGDGTGSTGTIRFDSFEATARLDHDIALTGLDITPELPHPGEEVRIDLSVRNQGLHPAAGFNVNLYWLENTMDDDPEHIGMYNFSGQLNPSESTIAAFQTTDLPAGYSLLRAEAEYLPDLQPENNIIEEEIFIRYPAQTLVINEILFHTRDGQPEFVEIYNTGNSGIDLYQWSIRDRETPGGSINQYTLSDTTLILESGAFAVLAADSTIFEWFNVNDAGAHIITANRVTLGLSSLGDDVMLLDPSGSVVDSVAYDPSWHHPDVAETRGRSLERISPHIESQEANNWSTTAHPRGGTPGEHNSLFTDTPVTTASIDVHPNPFSPNADGFEDHTIITYNLPQQTAMVRLRIFDSLGRHIRTLLNNQPSGPNGYIIWDGRNDNGQTARLGIYVILLEAYDSNRTGLTQLKSTVVVADRL